MKKEHELVKFGARLRMYREQAGLSQEFVARKMGFTSRATVSKWENGKSDPDMDKIKQLAKLFNIEPSVLMGWDEEEKEVSINSDLKTAITSSASERLKYVMKVLNKTPKEVALSVGSTEERIQNIMDGIDRYVDVRLMKKICDYFNVPYNFFITKRQEPVDDIVANIKALIDIDGYTVQEFCKRNNFALDQIEHPTFKVLQRIADIYGMELEDLFFRNFEEIKKDEKELLKVVLYISSASWLNRVGSMLTNKQFDEVISYAQFLVERDKKNG